MFVRKASQQTIVGTARVDRRTKRLVTRLKAGDVAIVDHQDIDRIAAEALVERRPSVVLNARASISGRYPSLGASVLLENELVVIDELGDAILDVDEGSSVRIEGAQVFVDNRLIAAGIRHNKESIQQRLEASKADISQELQAFAENTLRYIREESELLFDPPDPPDLGIEFKNRHVMVVVRGHDYRDDLAHLRSYVKDVRPVIVAVDGGADVCLQEGLVPDVIIGDFDSVSDDALRCGATLVVHAYVGGKAPGAQRLIELGLAYVVFEAPGMSEDVAMLLAYEEGAELIVAVGTHASMVEFLDKGREGMASTFLARLKVGPILVDAKGVSRLYQGTVRKSDLLFLLGAAMVVFVVMALVSYPFQTFISGGWFVLGELVSNFFDTVTPW